jgi:hypothetical protein
MGVPELKDKSPYRKMTLNEFIQTHYTCAGQPLVLQAMGPTLGQREFIVKRKMRAVAIDWVNNVEVDMLKYMSAETGRKTLKHYETHATTNKPTWVPNPLEDTVQETMETPTMTSNKRRKGGATPMNNPSAKPPGSVKQQTAANSSMSSTYHTHALQATKTLSYAQANFDYKLRHEVAEIRTKMEQLSSNSIIPQKADEKRLIELIGEHSAEQSIAKTEMVVDFSKDKVIEEMQQKINELQDATK